MLDFLQSLDIQPYVSFKRIVQRRTVFGKSWRVKHYEIITVVVTVKIIESVSTESLVPIVIREVHADIELCQLYGFRAAVYGMDQLSPTPHGINGEATCITEHV